MLTRAEANGNTSQPYIFIYFMADGQLEIMGHKMGSWKWMPQENRLFIKTEKNHYLNGTGKIIRHNLNELTTFKDGITCYYQKIRPDTIQKYNKNARLAGNWRIYSGTKTSGLLRLRLPSSFEFIEQTNSAADTTTGTWMYLPSEKAIVFVSFSPLRGKIFIHTQKDNRFTFISKGLSLAVRSSDLFPIVIMA
jgi:hypothetical protein